jgi:Glycosyltransferase sugar-binding region containing DXD motif
MTVTNSVKPSAEGPAQAPASTPHARLAPGPLGDASAAAASVPRSAFFIWLGADMPYAHRLAVRSAAQNGGFSRVLLLHEPVLARSAGYEELARTPGVVLRPIDDDAFADIPHEAALRALYQSLATPAAKANVLRLVTLYREGGVYLDTDTITVRPFADLCSESAFFCGAERIVYPKHVIDARNPLVRWAAHARSVVRMGLVLLPSGYRLFQRIEDFYALGVNNAVLGAAPRHPLCASMLETITALPEPARHVRFALGTHLLQAAVAAHPDDVRVYPPAWFYPLGPEISAHWFRTTSAPRLEDVLSPHTHVVHWYASVKTRKVVPRIDREYVERRAGEELYSALVSKYVEL